MSFFNSDIDNGFESGNDGGFEFRVEDEVGYENGSSVDKYIKVEVYVEIGDSIG